MAKQQTQFGNPANYNTTSSTRTDGDASALEVDFLGNLKTTLPYAYNNIKTATTTNVKSGKGFLHSITVNTTTAFAINVFDNTTATGATIANFPVSAIATTYIYDVNFTTGLTILTGGASDITVSYI
jgi:hypothetical protein